MGGSSSKQAFERNGSVRQSKKQMFNSIKQKCDKIGKQIKKLPLEEENYHTIKSTIDEVKATLQQISSDLKDKHRTLFDKYVNKCETLRSELNTKYNKTNTEEEEVYMSPEDLQTFLTQKEQPVEEIKVTEPPVEEPKIVDTDTLKKQQKKHKRNKISRKISAEEASFNQIHNVREEMVHLRDEILVFKGSKYDRIYHYLEESFRRCILKLETIETFEHIQIKHERKTAIAYAKESIEVLQKLTDGVQSIEIKNTSRADTPNMQNFKEILETKLKRMTLEGPALGLVKDKYTARRWIEETSADETSDDLDGGFKEPKLKSVQFQRYEDSSSGSSSSEDLQNIDDILHDLNTNSTEQLDSSLRVTSI